MYERTIRLPNKKITYDPATESNLTSNDRNGGEVAVTLPEIDHIIVRESLRFFTLAAKFRFMMECPETDKLFDDICSEIEFFEDRLRGHKIPESDVKKVSLCLCSLIDEHVFQTPWGSRSQWMNVGLSQKIHGNIDAGSAFFENLESIDSRGVLTIMYLCLSSGFMGKYRNHGNGDFLLREFKDEIYNKLTRPTFKPQNVIKKLRPLVYWKDDVSLSRSVLLVACLVGVALFGTYVYHQYHLDSYSDAPIARIDNATSRYIATLNKKKTPEKPQAISLLSYLSRRLADLDQQSLISLSGDADSVTLTIKGKAFRSGSARITKTYRSALEEVDRALKEVQGRMQINGHSDNQKIASARFPSNWHLSKARAKTIQSYLKASSDPKGQLTAAVSGIGAKEPLVPNSSAVNRQINRRVEIVINGQYLAH